MTASDPIPPDVQESIDKFNVEAEGIVKSLVDVLKAQEPPPLIYHYTNDVGLKGILEGNLWLTDIFDLNDPSEMNHGFSLMLNTLNKKVSGSPEGKKFADGLTAFRDRVGIQKTGNYFVCSFSASGDDLGQWRAYADNGRGFVLGFNTKELEAAFTKQGDPWFAQASPLAYDDAQLVEMHRRIIEKMLELISLPCSRAVQAAWYTYLTVHALSAGLHFKHEAYSNEQEYRFLEAHGIESPVPGIKLRPRRYSLVKYREFNWRKAVPEALNQIVIGPAADHQKASRFAKDCLDLLHSGTVKITHSEIPHRAV